MGAVPSTTTEWDDDANSGADPDSDMSAGVNAGTT